MSKMFSHFFKNITNRYNILDITKKTVRSLIEIAKRLKWRMAIFF